jgi:hypothetical protein
LKKNNIGISGAQHIAKARDPIDEKIMNVLDKLIERNQAFSQKNIQSC